MKLTPGNYGYFERKEKRYGKNETKSESKNTSGVYR